MSKPLSPLKKLLRLYAALTGGIFAHTIGVLDHYTPERRRFLSSGFICGSCKELLIKKTLVADLIIYDAQGNTFPMMKARAKGKFFACPRCGYRWELRRTKHSQ